MKILKSGIEVDPSDLKKLKGGSCSCHCVPPIGGTNLCVGAEEGDTC